MTSMSALIDFLMSLMRDEQTKMDFERNPEGRLKDEGLDGVTAQDVRDARLVMADEGSAHPRSGYSSDDDSNDPVQAIRHTTTTYEVDRSQHVHADVDQQFNILSIDDRDTTVIDSFNSEDTVTAIQDNDTTEVINIEDSFNEEETEEPTESPESPEGPTDDPAESPEAGEDGPTEPLEDVEDPEVSIDPVEPDPSDVPFDTEPEPEVSIQPVDESVELADEPDLEAEAAVG
ncbi:MAG TPA: IniB N-terminal domain-containing protein [Actinophytocola sp.]|nr:IniB N-terminal domain-containing protein [Actinophytocola sp.]